MKSSDNMEDVLDVSSENLKQLKEEAQLIDNDTLIRFIRICSELSSQLKYATQKRVMLEVAFIKLCRPQMEKEPDSLLDRIRVLEEKLEQGAGTVTEKIVYVPEGGTAPAKKPKPKLAKAISEEVRAVVKDFRGIAANLSPALRNYLKQARLSVGNQDQLLIVMPDEITFGVMNTDAHKEEIRSAFAAKTGKTVEIEIRQTEQGLKFEDSFVDVEKLIHMEITVED